VATGPAGAPTNRRNYIEERPKPSGERREAPKSSSAVGDLASRIVQASLSDAEALKSSIQGTDGKDKTKRWFAVVCEFLYFYMHLTNIVGHWPQNLKDGIERDFMANLNNSEMEYGECKQLLDRENPLGQDALFSKFAGNICDLLGLDKANPGAYAATFMKIIDLVLASFDRLNLRETLRAAGKEL
jgi:hypothetical protein